MQKMESQGKGGKLYKIDATGVAQIREFHRALAEQVYPKAIRDKIERDWTERKALEAMVDIASYTVKPGFVLCELSALLEKFNEIVAKNKSGIPPSAEEVQNLVLDHAVFGASPGGNPWPARENA